MQKFIIFLSLLFITAIQYGEASEHQQTKSFRVNYVSAENVYLDAGKMEGLNIGDKLKVQRNGQTVAQIEIVFLADYSASAVVVKQRLPVQPGDIAIPEKMATEQETTPEVTPEDTSEVQPEQPPEPPAPEAKKFRRSPFSGSFSLQYYYWNDLDNTNLDFAQPTVRLNIRGRQLWGKEYYLRIRGRLRHNQRERRLNTNAPESEWRNRIYELSFSYTEENALLNYQFGRIISNKFSGVGYIDGILLQMNTGEKFHTGVFGGTQPQWQYADFQTDIQKYGAYINLLSGGYSSGRLESTLALAGEYHGSTVSREFLYLQNSYYLSGSWNFYQSAELDINRKWRKDRSGNDYSLTNLYLAAQWNVTRAIIIGAIYDNRKNYLTYETRSLADSLFDEATRQGLRGTATFILPGNYRLFGNFGLRKRKTDVENTYSYSAGLSQPNFLSSGIRIFTNLAGFSNFYTRGFIYSFSTGRNLTRSVSLDLSIGGYLYDLKASQGSRNNQWSRINLITDFLKRLYFSGQYEYNWGDDVQGHRILLELGYRL